MPIDKKMETQNPPSKIARLADSRIGLASCWNMERNGSNNGGSVSPPIGLGLELGCGGSSHRRQIHGCTKSFGFTILQLQELKLQSVIYKYIEAGFPVPCYLVLPIWKSVASSLGGLNAAGLNQLCPSVMGCAPLYLEYTKAMDPEPGRCRRTDGKKWRCSKEALPDQKYCEKHIHRGRQRSRKLVEAASSSSTASTNLSISLPGSSASNST